MFKIKSEQIRVFQPDAEAAFVVQVMDYLKEKHADATVHLPQGISYTVADLPEETFREIVRVGLRRAGDYRIKWKSTLLSFVVLLFIVAPNFDRHPKARNFFNQTTIIDDEAMERFMDEMTDRDWEAIEKRYDPQAWKLMIVEEVNG